MSTEMDKKVLIALISGIMSSEDRIRNKDGEFIVNFDGDKICYLPNNENKELEFCLYNDKSDLYMPIFMFEIEDLEKMYDYLNNIGRSLPSENSIFSPDLHEKLKYYKEIKLTVKGKDGSELGYLGVIEPEDREYELKVVFISKLDEMSVLTIIPIDKERVTRTDVETAYEDILCYVETLTKLGDAIKKIT